MSIFKRKPEFDKEKGFFGFKKKDDTDRYLDRVADFDRNDYSVKHEKKQDDEYNNYEYGGYGGYGYGLGYKNYWETERGIGWDLKNGYSKSVRIDAAEKLGRMKTDEALDELIEAIEEKDEDVKVAIFKAIEMIGKDKAAEKLLKKVFGIFNKTEKINKIIAKLKEGKKDENKILLTALMFDDRLREKIGQLVDDDIAKNLWVMGKVAFPLIAEIAKDENKRKLLSDALAASDEETINEAIRSDEDIVSDIAVGVVGEKCDYRFIPALTDVIVKKINWQNAVMALLTIEKKMGIKVPKDAVFSNTRNRILFIVPTEEIGKAFERLFSDFESPVEWTTSYSRCKIEKKRLKRYKTVVIDDLAEGSGRDLVPFLKEKGIDVIYMSATKDHYKDLECKKVPYPFDLKELMDAIGIKETK